jgi:hypothetical protein
VIELGVVDVSGNEGGPGPAVSLKEELTLVPSGTGVPGHPLSLKVTPS